MTCDKVDAKVEVQADARKILEILGRHEQAYERKKFTNNIERDMFEEQKKSAVDKVEWVAFKRRTTTIFIKLRTHLD